MSELASYVVDYNQIIPRRLVIEANSPEQALQLAEKLKDTGEQRQEVCDHFRIQDIGEISYCTVVGE